MAEPTKVKMKLTVKYWKKEEITSYLVIQVVLKHPLTVDKMG